MDDSTSSELVYQQEMEEEELAKRIYQELMKPTAEDSLAKIANLLEIQTMCKVADSVMAVKNDGLAAAHDLVTEAVRRMKKMIEVERQYGGQE